MRIQRSAKAPVPLLTLGTALGNAIILFETRA